MVKEYGNLQEVGFIATGCTLGSEKIAIAFLKTGAKYFIGPARYVDGNAALLFVQYLFYHISKGEKINKAFKKAKTIDRETNQFIFFK
ncbi:MAG: hypothetical protein AAFZ15_07475 [Bacteroidota bacterium]